MRSSCASSRSSSSRAASASKDRSATSASAGPRHSDRASSSVSIATFGSMGSVFRASRTSASNRLASTSSGSTTGHTQAPCPRGRHHQGPFGGSKRMSGACSEPSRGARRPRRRRSACRPGRPGSHERRGSREPRAAWVPEGDRAIPRVDLQRAEQTELHPATVPRLPIVAQGDIVELRTQDRRRGLGTSAFCEAGLHPWSS